MESPRERRPFALLQPRSGGALPSEAVRGLPRLRLRVEPLVPALVRGLVAIAAHPTSLTGATTDLIGSLNKRRRAATEWMRAILEGGVDAATLRSVAEVWLPQLIGGSPDVVRRKAQSCIEYIRGAMTGLVMTRPEDNLVPEARTLFAVDSILAQHLGAVLGRTAHAPASAPRSTAKARV